MPINYFQTIDSVLTRGISEICSAFGASEDEAIQTAQRFLAQNSEQYYTENPEIEYQDPLCRWAYLYTYVGAHANLICNAITRFQPLKDLVQDKIQNLGRLNICSLGGGPGSELLGIVKYIERNCDLTKQIDLDFLLIDKTPEWDDSWYTLVNGLEEAFTQAYGNSRRDWPIILHRSFLPLDMLNQQSFSSYLSRFGGTELFILNHVVSELIAHQRDFAQVFDIIVSRAPDCAFFLFIDRNQTVVVDFINSLFDNNPELLAISNYTEQNSMDIDEEKRDLGRWYTTMGRAPKITWDAYYCLAQKICI